MGRLFTSFDEAWAFFLGRTEALERSTASSQTMKSSSPRDG